MTDAVTPPNPANPGGQRQQSDTKPDPTLMTIDALRREIAMLENLIDTRINDAEKLVVERFKRIDALMERAEEQRREQKADTAAAVNAALESQKEATTKMEKSISDQIASLRSNFETSIGSIQSNVGDLKDRLTILESIKVGVGEQKTEQRQISAGLVASIAAAGTLILAILAIIAFSTT